METKNNKNIITCPHAKKCGGCQYQGMDYTAQLKKKQKEMNKLLKDFGKPEPIIGMKDPLHYRNKVHAVFGRTRKGEIVSGTYEAGTHKIVNIDECIMLGDEIDPYQTGFLEMMKNMNFSLVPEKLPEAFPCTLKVDGSELEYDMMLKIQPVDPDKHILCISTENNSDGLNLTFTYNIESKKLTFTYKMCFTTWTEVRKFTVFQILATKGSVIKVETKEEKRAIFKATLQEPLSSESLEELKGDLKLIKDVILVETEFGISFSISDGFDEDDQEMLCFLANSIRRIPQEMQWTSYSAEARLIPESEAELKDLFKPSFFIKYIEIVNIRIQQIWIKDIKISNELKCCRFADPDQAYKDFISAQRSEDKRVKIELVPADEERTASRIAVLE